MSPLSLVSDTSVAELRHVTKRFTVHVPGQGRKHLRAVDDVSLAIPSGATLGLVGESGSGKSTLGRVLLRLVDVDEGEVLVDGDDITSARGSRLRAIRPKMQLVFQDPASSFDPLASVGDSIGEVIRHNRRMSPAARQERIHELLTLVGLPESFARRRPAQLSGGQLQRAAIARALAVDPKLIVLDEPVASLDVSTQAQVINLLTRLQMELGTSYLFISHDLAVVRHISHTIAVMYLGQVVEVGDARSIYDDPKHPYTVGLLSAVPIADPERRRARSRTTLVGDIPSPTDPPSGCRFRTRCPIATDMCARVEPAVVDIGGRTVRCHLYGPTGRGEA